MFVCVCVCFLLAQITALFVLLLTSLTPVDLFIFINYACRSLYELNFMEAKPARGFYRLTVSVAPKKADSRLIGTTGAEVSQCLHAFVCVCVWARIF